MKTKNMAGMIVGIAAVIIVGVLACLVLFWYSENRLNYEVIELIEGRQKRPGEFIDLDGQVQVDSADDLGFILKDSKIELHYGVQVIDIPYNSLDNKEWTSALGEIGIKVYRRKNDETGKWQYRITYWDEPIQVWSKVY